MNSAAAGAVKQAKAALKELATKGYCSLTQEKGFEEGSVAVPAAQLNEVIGKQGAVIRAIQVGRMRSTPLHLSAISFMPHHHHHHHHHHHKIPLDLR